MPRRLFCELSPFTYKLSVEKQILIRKIRWFMDRKRLARYTEQNPLEVSICKHHSLIQRTLGDVDQQLQMNKEKNLVLAVPKVNGIMIKPGEVFSFWKLVGRCTKSKGYKEGLIISLGNVGKGIGGGMCQLTNLIHWIILHSPLTILEHHHHNQVDLFPDYGRKLPFGTGTSIMYNYLDYQFVNHTNQTFQLLITIHKGYLYGELRSDKPLEYAYHIIEENHCFSREGDTFFRNNEVYRKVIDKKTGDLRDKELVVKNHARVLYDKEHIPIEQVI